MVTTLPLSVETLEPREELAMSANVHDERREACSARPGPDVVGCTVYARAKREVGERSGREDIQVSSLAQVSS